MNKFLLFFGIIWLSNVAAQKPPAVYESFPKEQEFYRGGKIKLFDEIRILLKDHNMQPCEDDQQSYTASILVRENGTAVFVKDFDSANIARNQCAYDMFRKVLPHLKGWVPAGGDGKPTAAIAEVPFIPAALFKEKIYRPSELSQHPEFPGGIIAFQKEFVKNFNMRLLDTQKFGTFRIQVVFTVNELGMMEDINVNGRRNSDFAVEAVAALKKIKIRWKPAEVSGMAVKARMLQPLSMQFE